QHHAGERRRAAGFGVERVRARRKDDLVALAAVHPCGNLVAHRPRRDVNRSLLAEQVGHALAQAVDRRVEHRLLVTDPRLGDRPAHAGRRLGPRVAVQVDHAGTRSAAAATARLATGSLRSQTAVSWNAAPPFGGAASALIRTLSATPSSKAAFGQMLSTTSTPGCWPSRISAWRRTEPRPLPRRTGSPAAMPSRLASSGWIRTVGRPSLRIEVGVSVKVVLR